MVRLNGMRDKLMELLTEVTPFNTGKKVAEIDCIIKTDLIDKTGSRRGASLYRFDLAKFNAVSKFKI